MWYLTIRMNGFYRAPSTQCLATIRQLLDRRAATQPTGEATCGFVLKNPPGDFAARLIEASALKGLREGGRTAVVSIKHANFIINTGKATATDIEQLIHRVKKEVTQQWGITLEPEVHCLGDAL